MRVMSLVGARPQFIKEAILCEQFEKHNIDEIIVNSGQHYDFNMSDIFFQNLKIKPAKYNLNIGSGRHGEMTGKIMLAFEDVVLKEFPDLILVYGDTNTTLAGAIVAAKLKIPVAHVEAGIRMEPRDMPEEINRVLVDRVSRYMFTPSAKGVENLAKDGLTDGVHFVGDVMYDLFLKLRDSFKYDVYDDLTLRENEYIVMTMHRDYNVDTKEKIEKILMQIAKVAKEMPVIFPIHPRTKKRVAEFGLDEYLSDVRIIDPVDYLNLMGLVSRSHSVITDSGGLQKEGYFAGKRVCVVMPDTGWIELIESGANALCDETNIYENVFTESSLNTPNGLYGDGTAGEKIATILKR